FLPKEKDGIPLRHAIEARNPSFATQAFYDLAAAHNVAIVYAKGEKVPEIDQTTTDFTYARLLVTNEDEETGLTSDELKSIASQVGGWSQRGEAFVYFISAAKVRNPAAATALIKELS